MNSNFLDISQKCRRPTVATLEEALRKRKDLSQHESNFITYMAGFSHSEFAKDLLEEFGLKLMLNESVIFDKIHQKIHGKVLINDLVDLPCFSNAGTPERIEENTISIDYFTNIIAWRNKDRSFVSNIREEIKNLNSTEYQNYIEQHIMGLEEDVLPYEVIYEDITYVAHIVTVPRNINANLGAVLSQVSNGIFVNGDDERSSLSILNLRLRTDIHHLLSNINWYIVETENSQEVIAFLNDINAIYTLIPYKGEEYNYFDDFLLNVLTSLSKNKDISDKIMKLRGRQT
jgi:hypothetical protein